MAVRADLADVRLADRIFAPHYAAHLAREVVAASTLTGERNGAAVGQVAPGACFEVLEMTAAHAWGVVRDSGLVGYLPLAALVDR